MAEIDFSKSLCYYTLVKYIFWLILCFLRASILTSILQSRVRYAGQSRVLGQVQQQQQINSVRNNNNTATSSVCVLVVGVAS